VVYVGKFATWPQKPNKQQSAPCTAENDGITMIHKRLGKGELGEGMVLAVFQKLSGAFSGFGFWQIKNNIQAFGGQVQGN
jgi:hypothetical protein